ncbi:unnamed protein product [Trifolium pratense]|uniref:Uncharacterized protein n=1 Tax=Trifolium pratense TaxID=57577 RepID=A0ACB0LMM1_TRIPR|nr:unnamed protein product [Trifolium pratense]
MGIAKHTDCGFMTMLQDQIGGLQVLRDNQWVNVPPIGYREELEDREEPDYIDYNVVNVVRFEILRRIGRLVENRKIGIVARFVRSY